MHYVYDLDGFRLVETGMELYDGQDILDDQHEALKADGWKQLYQYGGVEPLICVYQQTDDPDRGMYVVVKDITYPVYSCLVTPRAWPVFYRAELLGMEQARDSANVHSLLVDLVELFRKKFAEAQPVKPPRVRKPRKDKPVEPPVVTTPPVTTPPVTPPVTPPAVTPPVVTPPGQDKDKEKTK